MIQRLDRVALSWWFGPGVLLGICLFVVLTAGLLEPSRDVVSFFGVEIPVLCGWRTFTGWPCPGCGLTRSFSFMAHGRFLEAFQLNWFGPPAFLVVLAQVPMQSLKLWRGWKGLR